MARDQIAIAYDARSDMDTAVFAERAPTRVVREEWPARAEELCCTFRAAQQSGKLQIAQLVQQGLSNREIGCLTDQNDPPRRAQKRAGPGNQHPRLDRELETGSAAIHLDQDR